MALLGIGLGLGAAALFGGGDSGRKEADRVRDVAIQQRKDFQRAQEILGKAENEAISDVEAANLRAEGLISDAQEAVITRLNQTQVGAIETLKQQEAQAQELLKESEGDILGGILATSVLTSDTLKSQFGKAGADVDQAQSDILSSLVESGVVEREALTASTLQAFKDISGFSDRAFQALEPFAEQGRRSLLQSRVLGGTATQEEREQFESEFGPIAISPVAEERIKEQERATQRLQNALGNRFSGLGISEVLEKGSQRITGEEFQRQQELAVRGGQLGLSAASQQAQALSQAGQQTGVLRAGLGQNIAESLRSQSLTGAQARTTFGTQRSSFKSQLGKALADNLQRQQQLKAQAQQAFGLQRGQLAQQTGRDISNVQLNTGQLQAGALQDFGTASARLAQQGGVQTAGIRTGTATNVASALTQGSIAGGNLQTEAARIQSESEQARKSDVFGAIGQIGGAVIGAPGGPFGAQVGSQVGSQTGRRVSNFLA